MKKKIFFYLFICLMFSCKQEKIDTKVIEPSYDLSNNKKTTFFLKFWYNMSNEEFKKVVENLKNEEQIEEFDGKLFFIINECKLELVPNFQNNSLIEIKLVVNQVNVDYQSISNLSCIYPLYQKKYNLPKLIKKSNIESVLKENNPYYKPEMFYYSENKLTELPAFFNDNSPNINFETEFEKFAKKKKVTGPELKNAVQNIEEECFYLPENEYVIKNTNNVIKISQNLISTSFTRYSISLLPEYKQYCNSTLERMQESLKNESFSEKIKSNSKFKISIGYTINPLGVIKLIDF